MHTCHNSPYSCGVTAGNPKADLLLDALVDYWRERLTGDSLRAFIDRELDATMETVGGLTLNDVVTPEQVTATALKYASTWTIEGSIPELVGEIAARVYEKTSHDEAPLRNLIDQQQIQEFAVSLVALPAFRRLIFESPLTREWAVEMICHAVNSAALDGRIRAEHVPGVGQVLGAAELLMNRFAPGTRAQAELRLRELAEHIVGYFQDRAGHPLDDSTLADAAVDLWAEHADSPVSSIGDVVSGDDIEDFLVLSFEFFFRFRKTEYFRMVVSEGVEYFFAKYGDSTLSDLVEDIGVGRDDMAEEAYRFAPPILDLLVENGMFDAIVRRLHVDFFASDRVQRILR
jgi:hypothetical protein